MHKVTDYFRKKSRIYITMLLNLDNTAAFTNDLCKMNNDNVKPEPE